MEEVENLTGRRVLIIEDDYAIATILNDMMLDCGCEVAAVASDFASAMHGARENRFDIALLDVNLGDREAWPVADALAARGLPFVFITGGDGEDMPEAWRHVPRLQKPFRHADLLAGLTTTLRRSGN